MHSLKQWKEPNDFHQFTEELREALNSKFTACYYYSKLKEKAETDSEVSIIRQIIQHEERHCNELADMYCFLTGRKQNPKFSEGWLGNDEKSLYDMFSTEQRNAVYYLEMADRAPSPLFARQFQRAAAEEQQHAVWLLAFLTLHSLPVNTAGSLFYKNT